MFLRKNGVAKWIGRQEHGNKDGGLDATRADRDLVIMVTRVSKDRGVEALQEAAAEPFIMSELRLIGMGNRWLKLKPRCKNLKAI